jgi:hypothetical protein
MQPQEQEQEQEQDQNQVEEQGPVVLLKALIPRPFF